MSHIDFNLTSAQSRLSCISSVWYAGRHFEQVVANRTSFSGRVYHFLVGIIDLIPIVGRLASFAEKYFLEQATEQSDVSISSHSISRSNRQARLDREPAQPLLVSEERIQSLVAKYGNSGLGSNDTRINHETSFKKGGLFMYYDRSYRDSYRYENGKICLILGRKNGYDFPTLMIGVHDLNQQEKKHFIDALLPSRVNYYERVARGMYLCPVQKAGLDLLQELEQSVTH